MAELDDLLDSEDSNFSLINPEVIEAGEKIGQTLMSAGLEAWGTFLSRGVLYSPTKTRYLPVTDHFGDETEAQVVTTFTWSGDNQGTCHALIPESGAKGAIAFFLAIAMGTEADPEGLALDEESMDAYSELANTLLGQGGQALRADPGGDVNLTATETKVVDFRASNPEEVIGAEDCLCHSGQLTIEGLSPVTVRLLMPVSVTGMTADVPESRSVANDEMEALVNESQITNAAINEELARRLKVPLVVVLAEKKARLEVIQELSPGAIIEFRKLSGEYLDICAGESKFAEGEVVIVAQHFGIQIRKICPSLAPVQTSDAGVTF